MSPADVSLFTTAEQQWLSEANGSPSIPDSTRQQELNDWMAEPLGVRFMLLAFWSGYLPAPIQDPLPSTFRLPWDFEGGGADQAENTIASLYSDVTRWPGMLNRSPLFARQGETLTGQMTPAELAQFLKIEGQWLSADYAGDYADWQATGSATLPGWMDVPAGTRLLFYLQASDSGSHGNPAARSDLTLPSTAHSLPYVLAYYVNPHWSTPAQAATKFYGFADQMVTFYDSIQARLAAKAPNGTQAATGAGTQAGGGTGESGTATPGQGSSGLPNRPVTATAANSGGSGAIGILGLLALLLLMGKKK